MFQGMEYVYEVYKEKSFSKAARKMFISQPSLSANVKRVEKKQVRKDQAGKARIGAIGENLVVAKLMQQGWDAFNANCTIKNYKSIDVVCLNADMKESDEKTPKKIAKQAHISQENSYICNEL